MGLNIVWGACFGVFFLSGLAFLSGKQIYYETSDSMEPVIEKGSLLLVKEKSCYKKGDIVAYYTAFGGQPICVTHRIVDKLPGEYYIMKGDANLWKDERKISRAQILGQVTGHIPFLGYICSFIQQNCTFLFCVLAMTLLWESRIQRGKIQKDFYGKN